MARIYRHISLAFALCAAAFLAACGEGGKSVSGGRYIEGSETAESHKIALEGRFLLNKRLTPIGIDVTLIDENLDSIGTLKTELIRQRNGDINFVTDSVEIHTPYLRIGFTCAYADSSGGYAMDFVQYVDISNNSTPTLSLADALGSKRIQFLIQEDGFYLENARDKAMREIRGMLDFDPQGNMTLNDLIYQICIVEKPDTVFYASYEKLRNAVGEDKTWRDLFNETEIADTLFNHNRQERIWTEAFGLPSCDSTNYKDTASVTNKESAYYRKPFVCDNPEFSNIYKWRLMTELEKEIGVCTPALRDTLAFEHTVYTCDSAKAKWQKMPDKQGVPHLYGECTSETEGDSVLYDSTYYACTSLEDWRSRITYEWKVPAGEQWNDSVNILVRKHEGLCNGERAGETTAIDGKYYLCKDAVWREIDRYTYFLGECDSLGWNLWTEHHDSVGYFMCKRGEWSYSNGYTSKWEEILVPDFYGDKCTVALENYIKEYDGVYYICKNRWKSESECYWKVADDNELSVPLRRGKICTNENSGEVVEYDGRGYECKDYLWQTPSDYHLAVYRAMVRNGYDPEYCRNGSANTKLFWDDVDSTLYGCVVKYSDYNFGWGQVRRAPNKTTVFTEFNDPKALLEGVYEDNENFTISKDGWKYTFYYYTYGVNDDRLKYLRLKKVIPDTGIPLDISENENITAIRAIIGDSTVTLDKIEGKSTSFDTYFTDWKEKIIESTRCPDATLPSIKCVTDWDESTLDVKFAHYSENSYTTWEQAKALCPEGTHIPSAEEWLNNNYAGSFGTTRTSFMDVEQQNENSRNELFEAYYNLMWTSTEKDSETQYCFEYVVKGNNWNKPVIASGIVECPKDLYPMVQAICVNDREEK